MKRNSYKIYVCIIFIFISLTIVEAHAKAAYMSMGYYINKAGLIVIGDTKKGNKELDLTISVREVIKGDKTLVGQEIMIPDGREMADNIVPLDSKQIAVLLNSNWDTPDHNLLTLNFYQQPNELEALKLLANILSIKDERTRINELIKEFLKNNVHIQEQLFAEIAQMKNRDNFDLVSGLYDELNDGYQVKLIGMIVEMNDLRGVPMLIKALLSTSKATSDAAARGLYYNFPGAEGVTEAFEKYFKLGRDNDHFAARYLAKRYENEKYESLSKPEPKIKWLKASQMEEAGKIKLARDMYFSLIVDEKEDVFSRRMAAIKLLQDANDQEKIAIQKVMLPIFQKDVEGDNYLAMFESVKILRKWHNLESLPSFLNVLEKNDAIYEKSVQQATMAIRELGKDAREQAVIKIQKLIQSPPPSHLTGDNPMCYLLELIWLGDEKSILESRQVSHSVYKEAWEQIQPLVPLTGAEDEGLFLINVLKNSPRGIPYNDISRSWAIFRLGDLKENRAIPLLVDYIKRDAVEHGISNAKEALKNIAGDKVEQVIMTLLTDKEERIREVATEILCDLKGERILPLLRKMLKEENYGSRQVAFMRLGNYGIPEDLELLKPFCDFWNVGGGMNYCSCQAMVEIRERVNYDLNGPIIKSKASLLQDINAKSVK
ncbi:MAG: HEAT repeat domain-containing protein [Candidatus Omnitrophica bacterium]|nr:HEAT repeat domain-containing protein [Candidatus Omnitrophota bacterium]